MDTDLLSPDRYPLMASGGLFFVIVGAALMAGGAWPRLAKQLLAAGAFVAAVVTAVFAVRLTRPHGPPTSLQIWSLVGAVLLEVVLIQLVARAVWSRGTRTVTLSVLLVVAVHLVPMAVAFGPLVLGLALVAAAIAGAGLVLPRLSLNLLWFLDGVAKAAFGGLMLGAGVS